MEIQTQGLGWIAKQYRESGSRSPASQLGEFGLLSTFPHPCPGHLCFLRQHTDAHVCATWPSLLRPEKIRGLIGKSACCLWTRVFSCHFPCLSPTHVNLPERSRGQGGEGLGAAHLTDGRLAELLLPVPSSQSSDHLDGLGKRGALTSQS